jgi:hypothetical protein
MPRASSLSDRHFLAGKDNFAAWRSSELPDEFLQEGSKETHQVFGRCRNKPSKKKDLELRQSGSEFALLVRIPGPNSFFEVDP